MKVNYCLPIIKSDKNEILEIIKKNIESYQYFEIWLDYIKNLDEKFVKDLSKQYEDRIVFLFRRKNLEEIKLSYEKKIEIISQIANSGSYLDLDINQQKEELEYIKEKNLELQTIISYHNYKETPTSEKLHEIIEKILLYKPVILKISCFCNSENDSKNLLDILSKLKNRKIKFIVSGMGEFGTIVKAQGALNGNEMTFAPIKKSEQSAPGQVTKDDLERIITLILNS